MYVLQMFSPNALPVFPVFKNKTWKKKPNFDKPEFFFFYNLYVFE